MTKKKINVSDLVSNAVYAIGVDFSIAKSEYDAGRVRNAVNWYHMGSEIEQFVSVYCISEEDVYNDFAEKYREVFHKYINGTMADTFHNMFIADCRKD